MFMWLSIIIRLRETEIGLLLLNWTELCKIYRETKGGRARQSRPHDSRCQSCDWSRSTARLS